MIGTQRVARFFFPIGSIRRVWRGPARGLKFVVDRGIGVSYAFGRREAASPELFARVRPGTVAYDIGANKGQMTLSFSRAVGETGRVISFEPSPTELARLRQNVELNGLNNVTILALAVSDADGELEFVFAPDAPTQGKLGSVVSDASVDALRFTVKSTRLDSLLEAGHPPPAIMKIDTEGAGAAVLRGARNVLDRFFPDIYIELHNTEEQQAVRDELQSRGYALQSMDGAEVTDPMGGAHNALWCTRRR